MQQCLIVPLWLLRTIRQNNVALNQIRDGDVLHPFISSRDFQVYHYLNQYTKLIDPTGMSVDLWDSFDRPTITSSKFELTYHPFETISGSPGSAFNFDTSEGMAEALLGIRPDEGYYVDYEVQALDGDLTALFATLRSVQEKPRAVAASELFNKLLAILYANNSIGSIAHTSLMNSFIQLQR